MVSKILSSRYRIHELQQLALSFVRTVFVRKREVDEVASIWLLSIKSSIHVLLDNRTIWLPRSAELLSACVQVLRQVDQLPFRHSGRRDYHHRDTNVLPAYGGSTAEGCQILLVRVESLYFAAAGVAFAIVAILKCCAVARKMADGWPC